MKNIWLMTKKELASYFNSPVAYIVVCVFLLITGWLFFQQFFLAGEVSLRALFAIMPMLFMFFAPAITMRLLSEERKAGTMELLVTLPLRSVDIIVGKFLAAFGLLAIATTLTFTYPLSVTFLGQLDWGPVIGGYLGCFLLGASYLALGTFCSAVSRNQIVAFIIGLALCFVAFILDKIVMFFPPFMSGILQALCTDYHFKNIARGVLDTRDLLFYASFITTFLMLSVYSLESERLR